MAMLKKYTTSEDIQDEILENEKQMYFTFHCKLFASDHKHLQNALQFFMEPINVRFKRGNRNLQRSRQRKILWIWFV